MIAWGQTSRRACQVNEQLDSFERAFRAGRLQVADGEGFEPPIELLTLCRFSKPVPSATRPSLQNLAHDATCTQTAAGPQLVCAKNGVPGGGRRSRSPCGAERSPRAQTPLTSRPRGRRKERRKLTHQYSPCAHRRNVRLLTVAPSQQPYFARRNSAPFNDHCHPNRTRFGLPISHAIDAAYCGNMSKRRGLLCLRQSSNPKVAAAMVEQRNADPWLDSKH